MHVCAYNLHAVHRKTRVTIQGLVKTNWRASTNRSLGYFSIFSYTKSIQLYGCSGPGYCRMLIFLSIAFCVIDLIIMLIRRNHSITNSFHIKLTRDFVFWFIPTFSTVRISNNIFSIAFCVIDVISILIR